jgi:cytoskeletal protein RodZ
VNDQTVRELGAYLRWKRKEKGKSLDDVVKETRLRVEILRAMEEGDIHSLPAPVYARGMVKLYLEYLDSSELLPQYEEFLRIGEKGTLSGAPFAKPPVTRGFKRRDNRWIVILLALAVVVAGYLLWQQKGTLGNAIDRKVQQATVEAQIQEKEIPPASASLTPVAGVEVPSPEANSESDDLSWLPGHEAKPGSPAAVGLRQLEIFASEPCWIQVTRGGQSLFRGTMKKGETRVFSSETDIQVRYGKPFAVKVRWLGKDLGRPSSQQKVVTILYKADGSFSVR